MQTGISAHRHRRQIFFGKDSRLATVLHWTTAKILAMEISLRLLLTAGGLLMAILLLFVILLSAHLDI
jgi:hypothetical protein